ncbi:hypothetical protein KCU94_g36, partial [Aureobasidium melanogenum]
MEPQTPFACAKVCPRLVGRRGSRGADGQQAIVKGCGPQRDDNSQRQKVSDDLTNSSSTSSKPFAQSFISPDSS